MLATLPPPTRRPAPVTTAPATLTSGGGTVTWDGDAVAAEADDWLSEIVALAAAEVAYEAKTLISTTGHRIASTRTESGVEQTRRYVASRPGQPPNVDTARLWDSVRAELLSESAHADMYLVGSDVEYAGALEFGTVRMAARPWLRRALAQAIPRIEQALNQ